jgi:nucleoside-diphosphate-sugar epimerase
VRFDAVANRFAYLAGVRRALTIHGGGQQQRAFTHVRDAAAAIRLVLREPETVGHTYNVVGENASVLDLVEAIRTLDAAVETRRTHQDVQTDFNIVASPEALMRLGWAPTMTLTSGLAELYRRFDHFQPLAYASAARR